MAGSRVTRVHCVRCHMWTFLETAHLPKAHICGKCLEVQRLRARVRQLELRLEDMFLVRENEEIMDRDSNTEQIPGPRRRDGWVTVRKSEKKRSHGTRTAPEELPRNIKGGVTAGVEKAREGDQNTSEEGKSAGCEIVVGDGKVKGIDRRVCGQKRDSRMVVCLPGAGVQDVSERVEGILKGGGTESDVIVHVGEKDVGTKCRGDIRRQFRELGARLKCRASRVAFSGLLPVPGASRARNNEILQLNAWLKDWCRAEGFRFVDHWEVFMKEGQIYKRDGVQLTGKGIHILAGRLAGVYRQGLN